MNALPYAPRTRTALKILAAAGLATGAAPASAYTFDSGSTGADGALMITTDTTLPLPPDGMIHATQVVVSTGATLRFQANEMNTPVYLLSAGDVVIDGTIDVSGQNAVGQAGGAGGPGGWRGGNASTLNTEYGFGPGNEGSAFTYSPFITVLPVGGNGGNGGIGIAPAGGGGGGGAMVIAANGTIRGSGSILATGGLGAIQTAPSTRAQRGGGGAVRLVATNITGTFTMDASPGGATRADAIFLTATHVFSQTGALMLTRAPGPVLEILSVGGNALTPGTAAVVILPVGSSTTVPVTLRITGAPRLANYALRLSALGYGQQAFVYDTFTVDTSSGDPVELTRNLVLPRANLTYALFLRAP